MPRAIRLNDFVLLACEFEIVGEAVDRAAEVATGGADLEVSEPSGATPPEGWREGREGAGGDTPSEGGDEDDEPTARYAVDVEGAHLEYAVGEEDEEFVLILQAWLTDPTAPYQLHVATGARFDIPDPPVPVEEAASTLLFMAYPYLRETVSGITGRSPYQPFSLPPLAKLPHPRVTGEAGQAEE